jgi:hypothetical protein
MTSMRHRLSGRVAAVGAAALVAGTVTAMAATAPAQAATFSYACTTALGPATLSVNLTTNAPASLPANTAFPVTSMADVTVPASTADLLRSALGWKSFDGTSASHGTVNGTDSTFTLAVPRTSTGDAGADLHVIASGPSGTLPAAPVGTTFTIGGGAFVSTLQGYDATGTATGGPQTITCTPPTGDLTVSKTTVTSGLATTTTGSVGKPKATFGSKVPVTATVAGSDGSKPAGTVTFTSGKATSTATLANGTASTKLSKLPLGANKVDITFTPTDANAYVTSTGSTSVKITKDTSKTKTKATYAAKKSQATLKTTVKASNKEKAAGKVKYVVKLNGKTVKTFKASLKKGVAKKVLKITKAGKYKVTATYLGSSTVKKSKAKAVTFKV